MNDSFCQKIDKENLIEKYINGELSSSLVKKLEKHLTVCHKHEKAVALEKMIKEGITEYARNGIKANLRKRIQKTNETRSLILRFAAILFVATITPLILYYHFNIDKPVSSDKKESEMYSPVEAEEIKSMEKRKYETPVKSIKPQKDIGSAAEKQEKEIMIESPDLAEDEIGERPVQPAKVKREELKKPVKEEKELIEGLLGSSGERTMSSPSIPAANRATSGKGEIDKMKELPMMAPPSAARGKKSAADQISLEEEFMSDAVISEISSGGLAPEEESDRSGVDIERQLTNYDESVYECCDRYKQTVKDDSIIINIELTILQNGFVDNVNIINSSIKNEIIMECIIQKIKTFHFSKQKEKIIVEKKYVYKNLKDDVNRTADEEEKVK